MAGRLRRPGPRSTAFPARHDVLCPTDGKHSTDFLTFRAPSLMACCSARSISSIKRPTGSSSFFSGSSIAANCLRASKAISTSRSLVAATCQSARTFSVTGTGRVQKSAEGSLSASSRSMGACWTSCRTPRRLIPGGDTFLDGGQVAVKRRKPAEQVSRECQSYTGVIQSPSAQEKVRQLAPQVGTVHGAARPRGHGRLVAEHLRDAGGIWVI